MQKKLSVVQWDFEKIDDFTKNTFAAYDGQIRTDS